MYIHRFQHRAALGARYLTEYLLDRVSDPYDRTFLRPKPLDVICEVSYLCNLACPTCFRWTSKPDEHELTLEDWSVVLSKLKDWLGRFNLTFTGGEPFLRKDMLDIFRYASQIGLVTSVVSNGSLIDREFARRIVESGLDGLCLSLNSLRPEVHNETRGTPTSFDEVMRAIENMRASEGLRGRDGMRLSLSTTVVRENIGELVDMVKWTKATGLYGIHFQPIMQASTLPVFDKDGQFKMAPPGTPYKNLLKRKEVVDDATIDAAFEELAAMADSGYPIINSTPHLREMAIYLKDPTDPRVLAKTCQTGVKNLNIDPFGNVRLCSIMDVVGNVLKDPPAEIWRSAHALHQREQIRSCEKTCRLLFCNFKDLDLKHRVRRVVGAALSA
jgi:MoaA/NifB/PqqE/SkfB family radical SAM enzyme